MILTMTSRTAKRSARKPAPLIAAQAEGKAVRWWILAILVIATLAAYVSLCGCDFTTWDDNQNVSQNPYFNPPSIQGIAHFWVTPHMFLYIPVTYTVWGVLAAIAQLDQPDPSGIWLNPAIFHFANVMVHLLAVLAAYQLLLALTRKPWPACAGALLFALHPVQVESVAWVAGMKDVLCGFFSLCCLWQYVRFAQQDAEDSIEETSSHVRWTHYGIATAALVLAMLSKPSAMTVPLAAAVLDRWVVRRRWMRIGVALWPWAVLALACAIEAHLVQPAGASFDAGRLWQRPLLMGAALAFYLYKLLFPLHLAIQYNYSPHILLAGRWIYFAWLIPALLTLIIWLARRRAPWLLAAAAIVFFSVLPVLGLVPFQFERLSLTSDHYLYFAMIGPALAVAFGLTYLKGRSLRWIGGLYAAIIVLLAVRSALQTSYWRDTQTLFEHEVAVNPQSDLGYNKLASLALERNDIADAEALTEKSLAVRRDQSGAYLMWGNIMARKGQTAQAAQAFRTALAYDRDNDAAMASLAGALAQQGQLDEAMQLCRRAIEIEPSNFNAHLNLAIMLGRQNRVHEGLSEAQQAVAYGRGNAKAHEILGILLLQSGKPRDAVPELEEALRLDPNIPGARQVLSSISRAGQLRRQ